MRRHSLLFTLLLLLVLTLTVVPFIGYYEVGPGVLWGAGQQTASRFFWQFRVPRIIMALMAGAGLAASGMVYQSVFRNPLAEPYTLGIAGGASLGACIFLHWSALHRLGFLGVAGFGFLGALLSMLLVFSLTRLRRGFSSSTLLLAGVAMNFLFSSMILLLQYLSDPNQAFEMLRWIMGGLERTIGYDQILSLLPLIAAGVTILGLLCNELNLLAMGETLALSRGVNVPAVKKWLFFAVSLMVGAIVAFCGPIGFIGLMVPHICRRLVGPDHRRLLPVTLLLGALFLVLSDTLARVILAPVQLPVGILTSLLGGPFFLWLLLGRSSSIYFSEG